MSVGRRTAVLGVTAAVTGLLTVVAGCARGNRSGDAQWEARPVAVGSALALPAAGGTSAPAASPTPAAASASATATPKPTLTPKKPAPVKPSRDAAKAPKELPPVHVPATEANCSPSYSGSNADKKAVGDALDAAAKQRFWYNSAWELTVPRELMYAVAWQESGWQSAIVACDGGIGTMQVMSDTATWMNNRFGTSYDIHKPDDNAMLGGEYLAWLIKYFGDVYYQSSYVLSVPAAPGSVSLLDSVVSAYNYGFGAVDPTKGEDGIPNWGYVHNVEALMTNCPCFTS
jgi:soluble lytic murein transglycosylase-like protein